MMLYVLYYRPHISLCLLSIGIFISTVDLSLPIGHVVPSLAELGYQVVNTVLVAT